MSKKNGDKALFGRERKKKNLRRKRTRQLREELLVKESGADSKSTAETQSEPRD